MINVRNIKACIRSLVVLDLDTKKMYNNNPETEIKMRADQFNTWIKPKEKRSHFDITTFDAALYNKVAPDSLTLF